MMYGPYTSHPIERVTVAPVTIAFLHESEGEVRGGSLSELAPDGPAYSHAYHGARMGHAGMIFWKWERLRLIARLDEIRGFEVQEVSA